MRYLALLGTLLLASGCWGGEFNSVQEKAEPVTTTDASGVTSTTDGTTSTSGSGGSDSTTDSSSSTTTTTGSSGSGSEGSVDSTTSTTGDPGDCAPPTEISELSELVLGEYEVDDSNMCGGAPGRVTCADEPCLSVDLDVTLIPVSEDGLLFDVIVAPQDHRTVPMVHHCDSVFGKATCDWGLKITGDIPNVAEDVWTLELIETPTGYAVGDFYVKGYPHIKPGQISPIVPSGSSFGDDPNCQQSTWSFNYLLQEAWLQHLDKIHSLSWECAS